MIKAIDNRDLPDGFSEFEVTFSTHPEELAEARAQHEQFKRNCDWLASHAAEVFRHCGKHFCIAGQERFLADSAEEARALARGAHPEDAGAFVEYVPTERLPRIYAHRRLVAPV